MSREKLLTSCDVAKLAGVTPEAVRLWAREGRLRVAAQAESGIRFFRRADAERLIREREARLNGRRR